MRHRGPPLSDPACDDRPSKTRTIQAWRPVTASTTSGTRNTNAIPTTPTHSIGVSNGPLPEYRKSPLLGTAQYQKGAVVPAIAMAHAVMMAVHEATPAGSASRR